MDVSHLQIKVTTTGVTKVGNEIAALGDKADAAEKKVKKLTDKIDDLIKQQGALATATKNSSTTQVASYGDLSRAIGAVAKELQSMVNSLGKMANANMNLSGTQNQVIQGFQKKSQWGNVWTSTLKAMITAAAAYLSLNFAKGVIESADSWQSMQAKLKLATGSMELAKIEQGKLFDMAQRMRAPMEDMTRLYQRMVVPLEKLGKTAEQATKHVEFIALGLKLSGSTAAEASSTMLQYSQSINAGRLNGAEFNAVAEASPIILRKIEEYLWRTDEAFRKSGGNLKKWASDNKITTEVMQGAAEAALPAMQKAFKDIPITVDDVLTRIKNSWTKTIGELGQNSELSKKMVAALESLEKYMPQVATAVVQALAFMAEHFRTVITLIGAMMALGLTKWAVEAAAGLLKAAAAANALAAAQATATASMGAGAAAMGIGRVALAAMGGPLGLIVGALGVAATAWSLFGTKAKEATKDEGDNLEKEYPRVLKELNARIEKYKELNRQRALLGQPVKEADLDTSTPTGNLNGWKLRQAEAQKKLDEAQARLNKAQENHDIAAYSKAAGDLNSYRIAVQRASAKVEELSAAQAALNKEMKPTQDIAAENKRLKWRTDFEKMYPDTSAAGRKKAADDAVKEARKQAEEVGEIFTKADERRVREKFQHIAAQERADERYVASYKQKLLEIQEGNDSLRGKGAKIEDGPMAKAFEEMMKVQRAIEDNEAKIAAKKDGTNKLNDAELAALKAINEALKERRRIVLENGATEQAEAERKAAEAKADSALEKLNSYLDHDKADKFGNAMSEAFGKVGKAVGKAGDAVMTFYKRGQAAQRARDAAHRAYLEGPVKDELGYFIALREIEKREKDEKLDAIADVLGATKNMFKEHTAAYKVLNTAEQAFRAYQMYNAVKSAAVQIGLIDDTTFAQLESYAMVAADSIISTGIQIAQALGLGQVLALLGVVNQAKGEPYSAWARMAAMAGTMAALGFVVAGVTKDSVQDAPVTNTGTGTVLGDPTAQSKSIANSITKLKDVDTMTMRYSAQMLASLQNIEALLGGVANLVLRNGNVASANNLGIATWMVKNSKSPILQAEPLGIGKAVDSFLMGDPLLGGLRKTLAGLWGKTTQEIANAGVQMKGTLAQLMQGMGMQQFANVKVTSSSWFGLKKDVSYNTVTKDLKQVAPELANQLGLVFKSFSESIKAAAGPLGVNLDTIDARLKGFVLDLGQIDFKGLTGEQIQEKLAAVFGAAGDNLAKQAIPGLDRFQKVGEGYLETLVRVSSGVEQANFELEKLGMSATSLGLLLNTDAADVGGALVQQSIMLKEVGTQWGGGISEIIMSLSGSAEEIANTYKALKGAQRLMKNVNLGEYLTRDLLRAAGGLQEFTDALSAYRDGSFFTDAERQTMKLTNLQEDFSKLGLQMPATTAAFRNLVETLHGQGNDALATKVLLLAEAFSDWADTAANGTQAVQDAKSALEEAYNREKDAIEEVKNKFDDFVKSLKNFRNELITGDLSPLSNTEKYATLKGKFESTSAAAMAGDETALNAFENVAKEFLQFSREYNASGAGYNSDFQAVLDATNALEEYAGGRATDADRQLEALNKQVEGLLEINQSVLTVAQAIEALHKAMIPESSATPVGAVVTPSSTSTGQDAANAAMVAQLEALTQQVAALREENAQQAQMIAEATVVSNDQNAQAIIDGSSSDSSGGTLVFDSRQQQWDGF